MKRRLEMLIDKNLWMIALYILGLSIFALAGKAFSQPNVLVIFVDDQGHNEIGFTRDVYGTENPFLTPTIDELAATGIICKAAWVTAAQCAASKAGLVSGQHQQRFGFLYNPSNGEHSYHDALPADRLTMMERMPEEYTCGVFGKWHIGASAGARPTDRGADVYKGYLGGSRTYWGGQTVKYEEVWRHGTVNVESQIVGDYVTDVIGDEASEFISTTPEPWFALVSFNAPHLPNHALSSDLAMFPELSGDVKIRAAMTYALDRNVAKMLDAAPANTIVFYANDNGGSETHPQLRDNSPFRGGKGDTLEGGMRIPFIVRYPGNTPAIFEHPITTLDIAATVVAAAGGDMTDLDGADLIPHIDAGTPPHEAVYGCVPGGFSGPTSFGIWSVRRGQWKGVRSWGEDHYLYDIPVDLGEANDLSDEHPEIMAELIELLDRREAQFNKAQWQVLGETTHLNLGNHFIARPGTNRLSQQLGWTDAETGDTLTVREIDGISRLTLEIDGQDIEIDFHRGTGHDFFVNTIRGHGRIHGLPIILARSPEDGTPPSLIAEGGTLTIDAPARHIGGISVQGDVQGAWDPHTCAGDLDGDGNVSMSDLITVQSAWGPCDGCISDIDNDDVVGFADLSTVLGQWGTCD